MSDPPRTAFRLENQRVTISAFGDEWKEMKQIMKSIPVLILVLLLGIPVFAQTATLRGQVKDESGAVVAGAKVTISGPAGFSRTTMSGNDGSYSFGDVPSGQYTVEASAPGLAVRQPATVSLNAGVRTLNLVLNVVIENQQVTIQDNGRPTLSTDSANNAGAIVLRDKDLDQLSDDPADLAADLLAMAGPAAGPNGGAIFIDGFSGGDLPPKEAIREIRINQNPFSPEYDKVGFGRIEIFTKPGADKFHGSFGYNFATDKWNSRNPYAAEKAPFALEEISGSLSGPISKRASFSLNLAFEWHRNGNVINGVTLDPQTFVAAPFTGSVIASDFQARITPRVDYQLTPNNTLSVRYAYGNDDVHNAGVGGFNLASRGYHNDTPRHTLQITETAILGARVINETRFQYYRPEIISDANTAGFALQVLGAFNSGGNPLGRSIDTQNNFEFQNNTSVVSGAHTWKFGVRLRGATETSVAPQNFNGTFTFSGGLAPQLDANNQPVLDGSGQAVLVNISSIESYRRTLLFQQMGLPASQIRQLGGGASQFSINTGNPVISGSQFDLGAFAGDDWRVRPNLTLSFGLRYETQTNIHDWRDFSPRVAFAWAPAGTQNDHPKTVLRGGFGIFYDRFALGNILTAERYNGVVQQQFVIANPDFFPTVPAAAALPGTVPPSTIQRISPSLRAPYLMQSAVGVERQLPFNTTVAITYANSHYLHLFRSEDINAPLPGTFQPSIPGSGVFPLGRPGLVVLMESAGLYNQNQLIVNVNTKVNRNISLNGSYSYMRAMSNSDGLGTFPANPYSMAGEYGPAATDIHHRVYVGGSVTFPLGIRLNPLLIVTTGQPFDITAGQDLYGDTLFNGRPGIATDPNKPGLVATKYGLLDPNPTPGEQLVSRNFGRGPGQITLNMRVGRTFAFGSSQDRRGAADAPGGAPDSRRIPTGPFSTGGGGGQGGGASSSERRYGLTLSMQIRNVTNHTNPGPIIGNLTAPLFGQANQPAGAGGVFSESANNRRLELQLRFSF